MDNYAGFWLRVGASLIDFIIIIAVLMTILAIFGVPLIEESQSVEYGFADVASLVVGIAYHAGFESSKMQGTPGKRALGLVVTDVNGNRISFLRAVGRYFGKIISAIILFIGFIMVAFTERKRGLHDMIASTLVLRASPGETGVDPTVFS